MIVRTFPVWICQNSQKSRESCQIMVLEKKAVFCEVFAEGSLPERHTLVLKIAIIWKIWPEMGRRGSVWVENGWK